MPSGLRRSRKLRPAACHHRRAAGWWRLRVFRNPDGNRRPTKGDTAFKLLIDAVLRLLSLVLLPLHRLTKLVRWELKFLLKILPARVLFVVILEKQSGGGRAPFSS